MQDIKTISKAMATEFAEAVRLAERQDAEEIESVLRAQNDCWAVFCAKKNEALNVRIEGIDKLAAARIAMEDGSALLDKALNAEGLAEAEYAATMNELAARLDTFRLMKIADHPKPKPNGTIQ